MRIDVNPDKEFAREMRKAIKDNNGHCPCQLERSKDTLCMCKAFRDMEEGTCHCGLYTKTKE